MKALKGLLTNFFTFVGLLSPYCWAEVNNNSQLNNSISLTESVISELKEKSVSFKKFGMTYRFRMLAEDGDKKPEVLKKILLQTNRLLDSNTIETALGPGSTGGSFANYRGSYRALTELVRKNLTKLLNMSDEYFDYYIPQQYKGILTRKKFLSHLNNLEYSYFQQGYSVAPNGKIDSLMADFATDSGEIILLKNFFQTYNQEVPTAEHKLAMARVVFHEITHLFGIGLNNDDESYELSLLLLYALYDYDFLCGSTGSLEEDIQNCAEKSVSFQSRTYRIKRDALEFPVGSKQFMRPIAVLKINQLAPYLTGDEDKSSSEFVVAFNQLLKQQPMRLFHFPEFSPIPHRFDFFTAVGIYENNGMLVSSYTMDLGVFSKGSNPRKVLEEFCSNFTMVNRTYRELHWILSTEDKPTQECLRQPGPRFCNKFMKFYCVANLNGG